MRARNKQPPLDSFAFLFLKKRVHNGIALCKALSNKCVTVIFELGLSRRLAAACGSITNASGVPSHDVRFLLDVSVRSARATAAAAQPWLFIDFFFYVQCLVAA